jgi:Ni,Fe-hydrogenase III large subunit
MSIHHWSASNCQPMALAEIPLLTGDAFREELAEQLRRGCPLSALFGQARSAQTVRLYAVTSEASTATLRVWATDVFDRYPSLTPACPAAHWFEREIAEQWGVKPEGHPWLKPIRFHPSYCAGRDAWDRQPGEAIVPGVTDYYRVEGQEVHEVAVGPVHAGVIEPGHFRFQCLGEHVFHLEIELGYQHRGIERRLVGGPNKRTIPYMEALAGDTTIGHTTAYCQAVEALAGREASLRAQALRAVALELERLANHTGDLGALAVDIGFLPTSAFCGRLRGDFLNTSALLCGSRFGRGMVRPGGVAFDVDQPRSEQVQSRVDRDVRRDFPAGFFRFAQLPISSWHTGDVFARAYVRWLEIQRSARFVIEQLRGLPRGDLRRDLGTLRPNSLVVSLVEGWRGEICHVAITDDEGRFGHYKVIDPSFRNWIGLALALRNEPISDFPVCNKSFNLSYCGHDL